MAQVSSSCSTPSYVRAPPPPPRIRRGAEPASAVVRGAVAGTAPGVRGAPFLPPSCPRTSRVDLDPRLDCCLDPLLLLMLLLLLLLLLLPWPACAVPAACPRPPSRRCCPPCASSRPDPTRPPPGGHAQVLRDVSAAPRHHGAVARDGLAPPVRCARLPTISHPVLRREGADRFVSPSCPPGPGGTLGDCPVLRPAGGAASERATWRATASRGLCLRLSRPTSTPPGDLRLSFFPSPINRWRSASPSAAAPICPSSLAPPKTPRCHWGQRLKDVV